MAQKFTLVTADFVNPDDYPIGIVKDATINESSPNDNYGAGFTITGRMAIGCASSGGAGGRNYRHMVLEIKMPSKNDIAGLDEIETVEIILFQGGLVPYSGATFMVIAITEIPDDFDEGTGVGSPGWCNWNQYIDGVEWTRGGGAVDSFNAVDDNDKPIFDTYRLTYPPPAFITLDLTESLQENDRKRYAICIINSDVSAGVGASDYAAQRFFTKEELTSLDKRPILRVTYRDYAIEAFADSDSDLNISPYENNKEFPILKWGAVKNEDFVDFKLYRSTSPITSVAALTPIATITNPSEQEYIDTTIPTDGSGDGVTYYYMVIAEDGQNTGDGATFSRNVSFRKPNISTATVTPPGASNVGTELTLTVGSSVNIKKLYVDWKDGSTPWYTFETVGVSKSVEHTYSAKVSSTTLSLRIESEFGYWSSLRPSTTTISLVDTTPKAVLIARPKRIIAGENVYLNASLSHPMASNEVISEYRYYDGVSWTGWLVNDAFHNFVVSTPGTRSVRCEVKTSGGLTDLSDFITITIDSNVATLLQFSKDTVITSRGEKRNNFISTNPIEGGVGEIDVQSGLSNIEISLNGISARMNLNADITILRNAVVNYSFVKILVKDEICGSYVYYEGRITEYSINKSSDRIASWSATMRVTNRTVV